jgi:hypothetical protein
MPPATATACAARRGLLRLWPIRRRGGLRQTLATLAARPLRPEAPLLGATLQQLRSLRDGRNTP